MAIVGTGSKAMSDLVNVINKVIPGLMMPVENDTITRAKLFSSVEGKLWGSIDYVTPEGKSKHTGRNMKNVSIEDIKKVWDEQITPWLERYCQKLEHCIDISIVAELEDVIIVKPTLLAEEQL